MQTSSTNNIRKTTYLALLTALVIVLQLAGNFIVIPGTLFSVSLVLLPIVLGAVVSGPFGGAWLGFIFGMTVLVSGGAAAFWGINDLAPITTTIVVLGKGILSGLIAGLVYNTAKAKSETVATVLAALVCPVVNTGVFLLGSFLFFWNTINEWAVAAGINVLPFLIFGMGLINFPLELALNMVLCPVIIRLIKLIPTDRKNNH